MFHGLFLVIVLFLCVRVAYNCVPDMCCWIKYNKDWILLVIFLFTMHIFLHSRSHIPSLPHICIHPCFIHIPITNNQLNILHSTNAENNNKTMATLWAVNEHRPIEPAYESCFIQKFISFAHVVASAEEPYFRLVHLLVYQYRTFWALYILRILNAFTNFKQHQSIKSGPLWKE